MYVNIKEVDELKFNSCFGCEQNCCNGSRISLSPLILEDFEEVYKNFAIMFVKIDSETKPVIVLNNGKEPCVYYEDGQCGIYETRAPACRIYPMSPYIDGSVYVDMSCPAVGDIGSFLCNSEKFSNTYYHKRFENITQKLKTTFELMEKIKSDLVIECKVKNMLLYKYKGDLNNDFINMHYESLKHLNCDKINI